VTYSVKEIFTTLQGEGAYSGRVAVFCRFTGCNLWSGREEDRPEATCTFCDTDFVGTDGSGGGKFGSAQDLARAITLAWGDEAKNRFVVLTGGEPLLQVDNTLIEAIHADGFEIAVETNGTVELPIGLDWVCVSPKAGAEWKVRMGDELKLVYPQEKLRPEDMGEFRFRHLWLQPMDGPNRVENTERAIQYCLKNPQWRLSLQTHKLIGIP